MPQKTKIRKEIFRKKKLACPELWQNLITYQKSVNISK